MGLFQTIRLWGSWTIWLIYICFSIILCFLLRLLLCAKWLLCQVQAQTFSLQDTSAADPAQRSCSILFPCEHTDARGELREELVHANCPLSTCTQCKWKQLPAHAPSAAWPFLQRPHVVGSSGNMSSDEHKEEACSTYQS